MRRQAKPFMVEIRKSRKPSSGGEPLFSPDDIPPPIAASESAAMVAARKLFSPAAQAPSPREAIRVDAEDSTIAHEGAVRTRILPDLSRQEQAASAAIPAQAEKSKPIGRKAGTKGKRADTSKAKQLAALPKPRESAPRAQAGPATANVFGKVRGEISQPDLAKEIQWNVRLLARRRSGGAAGQLGLRAGERWKRRLPPALW